MATPAAAVAAAAAEAMVAFWPSDELAMLSPAEASSFRPAAWNRGLNKISSAGSEKRNARARQSHVHPCNPPLKLNLRLFTITQSLHPL